MSYLTAHVTFELAANLNFENLDQISFIESLSHQVLDSNHHITVHAPASFLNGQFPSSNGQAEVDFGAPMFSTMPAVGPTPFYLPSFLQPFDIMYYYVLVP